jgi:hypothetical protein
MPMGVIFFPLALAPVSNAILRNSKLKKIERRHFQWRLCTNVPMGLARLHNAIGSGALPFIFLKF